MIYPQRKDFATDEDYRQAWREVYEERAAIMQFDGNMTKAAAEEVARELLREAFLRADR